MGSRPLRWGLLGTGRMAARFARELRAAGRAPAAAAGRDADRARAFAAAEGIPRYHASYEALIADPAVDAVHLSLPGDLHAEWSARAAEAGKHVLCEKPAALRGSEAERVLAAARRAGTFHMEGFMFRFHPQWDLVRALVEEGRIGRPTALESAFRYDLAASGRGPGDLRLRPGSGGALLDVGCYCLAFSRMLAGAEPSACEAESVVEGGVDVETRARLGFPGGLVATFACGLRGPKAHRAVVRGTGGEVEVASPWHPDPLRAEVRLRVPGEEDEVYHAGDGLAAFAREAALVEEHVDARECPAATRSDFLGQARALEAVRRAAGLI